ncbi:Hsp70 family protein [Rhodococcus sp. IEGM 1330]|uniref:Hsp70 family protein n=1 Tax=Rhodococcus sp. IEGM 1330 TaxID=3082225 RepID=UPI0029544D77|nr:Hsp70 family protein [Rhodococcus sp. IEGM 1330]MDV8023475.1 Hsp70 family protein [Rhodococcus sp. IEGM 1330]
MTEVLGVSVGASAVRMARPDARPQDSGRLDFHHDTVDAYWDRAEELAAESIGVVLSQPGDGGPVQATGVAYRDQQQFGEIQQAMASQRLYNYRLVPEARAALQYLEASGELGHFGTIALYDLGSSGLTISVIDRGTGQVLLAERTIDISGDDFDRLISDNQLAKQGVDIADNQELSEFTARCRVAKEQLSTSGAVCLPGDGGVILISREAFESLVTVPIEYSARLVRDVIGRSPKHVDALFLIGGGARIPLVESILGAWIGLPVVTPANPESVAARGAALLATPVADAPRQPSPQPGVGQSPSDPASLTGAPDWLSPEPAGDKPVDSKRKVRGAVLVAGGLVAVAALGLSLGYGGSSTEPTSAPAETSAPATAEPTTPRTSAPPTTAPPTTTAAPTTEAAQAPARTYSEPEYVPPVVPAPAPAPPPLIPGLPQIQLPQIQLPAPPVIELPRF